jgi:hypothetical protein
VATFVYVPAAVPYARKRRTPLAPLVSVPMFQVMVPLAPMAGALDGRSVTPVATPA